MKQVYVVGTVGVPACYGGFETLVENLVAGACERGIQYTVFCSKPYYDQLGHVYRGAQLIHLPLKANGIQSILYDIWSLLVALKRKPDVVLILGVSGCLFLPVFKLLSRTKVIVNIDGLEWRRQKWGRFARWFLKLSERMAVKYSDEVISDNEAINEYVNAEYNTSSHVIAYGGDHALKNRQLGKGKGYALALCRIEPENNVTLILHAFSQVTTQLYFIGNWENSEFGKQLKARYSQYQNIHLVDQVYDPDVLFEYRDGCSVYVHGHSAGGTNPSLVEMMFFSKPIFAYDCSFNRHTTDNQALYFDNEQSLLDSVVSWERGCCKSDVGNQMSRLAEDQYTWQKILSSYEELY